jgi:UDP-N-acetylmuramoyl-L-alanyl-D-glutamate--2,6-diaminopimelate ligase
MNLHELLGVLRKHDLLVAAPPDDPALDSLTVDSREVRPGALFIAVRGAVSDGHAFVPQALRGGATAVVTEHPIDAPLPVVVVDDGRRAAQLLAEHWFGYPANSLELVGITGTNGKTTTTALLRHLCNHHGDAGSIGTLGAFDGAGRAIPSSAGSLTTPGPVDLQATLRGLVAAGVRTVVMEASSHALDQGRLDALTYQAGVFTNLTRDHLDYHGTMPAYLAAKLRLADLVAGDGVLSVNADDAAWEPLLGDGRTITWGASPYAMLTVSGVECSASGSRFRLAGRFGSGDVKLPLPGDFNVSNAMAAAAVLLGRGMSLAEVVARIESAPPVPGRMEVLSADPVHVLRDYAHTPDALERALRTLRPLTPGRLIVVVGCGGDRDKGKRPMMGALATDLADLAIVTSDNPRTEDPEQIIDDIVAGLPEGSYRRLLDRRVAIGEALRQATRGDTVLLVGKGHETYQIIGREKLPFDEREIVLEALAR